MNNVIGNNEGQDIPKKRIPTTHEVIRKFDRMFPGIGYEENMYERDLGSQGSIIANFNRRMRYQIASDTLRNKLSIDNKKPLAEVLDSIILGGDYFYVVAKDENDKPIIDHEKKTVKFFNRETKEELFIDFIADEEIHT